MKDARSVGAVRSEVVEGKARRLMLVPPLSEDVLRERRRRRELVLRVGLMVFGAAVLALLVIG